MKKALYFLVVALIAMAFSPAPKFTITGNIAGLPDGTVYLKQRVEGNVVNLDSAKSVGGKFVLKGSVANPEQCSLVLGDRKQVSLFVENKDIQVTGKSEDLRNVTITGSASQDEMKSLDAKGAELNSKMKEFYDKYNDAKKQSNQAEMTKWEKQIDALDSTQTVLMKNFIAENPKSFVAPVILQRIQYGMEANEIDGYLKKLSADVKKGSAAKSLAERVAVLRAVAVGMTAPDFTQNDSINVPVKLSDVYSKHKYTLIDFWASWCGPCRGENPNVVAVWKDFNAKGFHVMGVSYDTDKAKWLKAVATDKLTWTQVSDLKGWSNATAKIYGINSIPANLLLDNTGKIIGKNLRGDKLRAKITELLK
jgi:peroxiredoxin